MATTGTSSDDVEKIDSAYLMEPTDDDDNGIVDAPTATAATINERTSFTADSPYFSSFCDNEVKSLHILHDALVEIAARTKTFVRTGELMSEATRRLALSCRLRKDVGADAEQEEKMNEEEMVQHRIEAVGEGMTKLLGLLGDVSWWVNMLSKSLRLGIEPSAPVRNIHIHARLSRILLRTLSHSHHTRYSRM
jgi:hypothetical protein